MYWAHTINYLKEMNWRFDRASKKSINVTIHWAPADEDLYFTNYVSKINTSKT